MENYENEKTKVQNPTIVDETLEIIKMINTLNNFTFCDQYKQRHRPALKPHSAFGREKRILNMHSLFFKETRRLYNVSLYRIKYVICVF